MPEFAGHTIQGTIFEIQRFSIHDGPGIRTTVFLKGCPLNCAWCHNPEGISARPHLSFVPEKCIGCGYCFRACPKVAHSWQDGRHVLDREVCVACGTCAAECYAGGLELVGRSITVGEALDEVLRDEPFYQTSGGGMTLSGGEPLYQIEFSEALLDAAKQAGLHCCVETSGCAPYERLRPSTDLFLYDIKESDPERHRQYTGAGVEQILDNLRILHARGARLRLRCPIVPGYNDRPDHFEGIAALARSLPGLDGVEVMPYHSFGDSKLDRMGLSAEGRAQSRIPEAPEIAGWVKCLRDLGAPVINDLPDSPPIRV
jgi:pyruvate formate lyase activating enzyme